MAIEQNKALTTEARDKITEIQDLLINPHVERKELLERGNRTRAQELAGEIKEQRSSLIKPIAAG